MAGKIPDEVLDSIRDRVSIVEVISSHVALKKTGSNFVGLCPFHSEKSPSFTVSDDRGLYHCFGCGEGGTVFTFVMKVEGLGFREAAEQLAARAGVDLPTDDRDVASRDYRSRLYQLNEAAQKRYALGLASDAGADARQYLERRGLTPETIARFELGFCVPSGSEFLRALQGRAPAQSAAEELGLLGRRRDGGLYERMWGRVTFPIRDGSGRIVGFGGRALGEQNPKYLNSPESPLFHKGATLYGLYEARDAVRKHGEIILVEGYMDVVALAQAGIENVVANLGTALTDTQVRLARRFASRVVAFFDGDRAGRSAALRSVELFEGLFAETGVEGFVAFLPEGEDPDSYVRKHGPVNTRQLTAEARPLWSFFLDQVDTGSEGSLVQRESAIEKVGAVIAKVRDLNRLSLMARDAAQRLGVDEAVFRRAGKTPTPSPPRRLPDEAADGSPPAPGIELAREEFALLEVAALDRAASRYVEEHEVYELLSPPAASLARAIADAWEVHDSTTSVVDAMPPALAASITRGLLGDGPWSDAESRLAVVDGCIARLRQREARERMRHARQRLREAEASGDSAAFRASLEQSNDLIRRGRRDPADDERSD